MAVNGRLAMSSLMFILNWAYLERRAARAFLAASRELVSLGYPALEISTPDGAYRTFDRQVYWKAYWTARHLPNNAASPGYSNHGLGLAVDIFNVGRWPRATLVRVLAKYGFTFTVSSEPWHALHDGREVSDTAVAGASAPVLITPTAPTPKKKLGAPAMYLRRATTGGIYLYTESGRAMIGQPSHVDLFTRMFTQYPSFDDMLQAELDIMFVYIQAARGDRSQEILNAVNAGVGQVRADLNYLQVDGPYSFKKIYESLSKLSAVDPTPVVNAVTAALKNVGVTVDYNKIGLAVETQLVDNFAAVTAESKKHDDLLAAAMMKVGTVDIAPVVAAVERAVAAQKITVTPEVAGTIAGAVRSAIAPDLVRLELKNQLAK